VSGASAYLVARWTSSGWSGVSLGITPTTNIAWRSGLNRYSIFAVMPTGEAQAHEEFWTWR